ncbi:MAG: hypothetical protein COA58_00795 [Bacteroidetes bacterium]|nr:MAG: hypothetical protein COA58_00795 [Bacteroidota bacterium]
MKIFLPLIVFCLFTLSVDAQLDVQIKQGNRTVCINESLVFQDSIINGTPTTYEWISSIATFSSTSASMTQASFSGSGDVILKTQDGTNTYYDTVQVTVDTIPTIMLSPNMNVCCEFGNIFLNLNVLEPTSNLSYGSWSCTQYPNLVQNNVFYTDSVCALIPWGAKSIGVYVTYTYQNPSSNCINSDSMLIAVNRLPTIVTQNGQFCQDIGAIDLSEELILSPVNTFLGFPSWRCLDSNSSSNKFYANMLENRGSPFAPDWWLNLEKPNYTITNTDKDTIILEFTYINSDGCPSTGAVSIFLWRVPEIAFSSNRELCWDEGKISLNTLTGVNLTDGMWSVYDSTGYDLAVNLGSFDNDTINTLNSIQDTISHSWIIRYDHVATGCPARNDTILTINPVPQLTLTPLTSSQFCETQSNIQLEASPSGGVWSANDPDVLIGDSLSPTNASILNQEKEVFYNYTDAVTGCSNADTLVYRIDEVPMFTLFPDDMVVCRLPSASTKSVNFKFEADNSPAILWSDFSNQVTLTPLVAGEGIASFSSLNNARDTFTIIVSAEGLYSCNDIDSTFEMVIVEDANCVLAVDRLTNAIFRIYPNPSNGLVTIKGDLEVIECLNSLGQKIWVERVGNNSYRIDSKGVNVLLLKDLKTGSTSYQKLIVK